jgi:hypothetical protein
MTRIEIYKLIRQHGGYVVGESAKNAWAMSEHVPLALDIGLTVTWEYEQDDWMEFAGDPIEEYRRNFHSGKWRCYYAYVKDDSGYILASLGGIILDSTNQVQGYRQVVEFELLAEAIQEIKRGAA